MRLERKGGERSKNTCFSLNTEAKKGGGKKEGGG